MRLGTLIGLCFLLIGCVNVGQAVQTGGNCRMLGTSCLELDSSGEVLVEYGTECRGDDRLGYECNNGCQQIVTNCALEFGDVECIGLKSVGCEAFGEKSRCVFDCNKGESSFSLLS